VDTNLKIDFCSFKAAKFAVENWHYSHKMPAGKLVKLGVWENEQFVGAVIFGRGANNNAAKSFHLTQFECCELVRIALKEHKTAVTRIVSIALKMLKKVNPGLKLVFSYADETNQGHKGIIYKAGNWEYLGERVANNGYIKVNGKVIHTRSMSSKYGSLRKIPFQWEYVGGQKKHLFVYHLR